MNPDSFLVLHLTQKSPDADDTAPKKWVAKIEPDDALRAGFKALYGRDIAAADAASSYGLTYRDGDMEGRVYVFERPKTEYAGDAKTNYAQLHAAVVPAIYAALKPSPDQNDLSVFETYGENRPAPLPADQLPFPVVPETPYHTRRDFTLYAGAWDKNLTPTLYRFLITSPDGKEDATGRALAYYTRTPPGPDAPLNGFLAYQIQVAKVLFLTRDFIAAKPKIREAWQGVKNDLQAVNTPPDERQKTGASSASPPDDLQKLSAGHDTLIWYKYELKKQLNTLAVAVFHLRVLQPDVRENTPAAEPRPLHLFSAQEEKNESLRVALQTELDYIDPLLEHIAYKVQQLSVQAQEKRNVLARTEADVREYLGVFLAGAGTFWAAMQTTFEFAKQWWRWPLVWSTGAVAFAVALWVFNRHAPLKSDIDDTQVWEAQKAKKHLHVQQAEGIFIGAGVLLTWSYLRALWMQGIHWITWEEYKVIILSLYPLALLGLFGLFVILPRRTLKTQAPAKGAGTTKAPADALLPPSPAETTSNAGAAAALPGNAPSDGNLVASTNGNSSNGLPHHGWASGNAEAPNVITSGAGRRSE